MKKLHAEHLGKPGSEKAHHPQHTSCVPRVINRDPQDIVELTEPMRSACRRRLTASPCRRDMLASREAVVPLLFESERKK